MTKRSSVIFPALLLILTAATGALAQDIPLSSRLSFREVTLTLRDGAVVRGRLTGASANSILVRQGGEDRSFALTDLRDVVIATEPRPSQGVAPGIALALYAGNSLLLHARARTGFYTTRIHASSLASFWLLAGEAFFTAMGAGAGFIAGSGGGRHAFDFPAAPGDALRARERFVRFLAGEPAPRRIHIVIQSGFLIPGSSRRFGDLMAEAGYTHYRSSLSSFSALRGLELSCSINPRIRAGLRVSFASEPSFAWYSMSAIEGTYRNASQELRATALHGIGALTWSAGGRARSLSLSAGLGAGAAAVRLSRHASAYIPAVSGAGSTIDENVEVRKTVPSAVVFGGLDLPLSDVLSIGLAADLTLIPAVTVPALPGNGFGSQKTGLSSGSVGFLLGYHF